MSSLSRVTERVLPPPERGQPRLQQRQQRDDLLHRHGEERQVLRPGLHPLHTRYDVSRIKCWVNNCLLQSRVWTPVTCGLCVLTAQTWCRPPLGLAGGLTSIPSKWSPSSSLTSSQGGQQRPLTEAVPFLMWLHSSLTKTREPWCESVSAPLCFTENPIKSQTVNPEKWQLHPAADPPASWEWAATLILATGPGRALAAKAQQFESEKRWCSGEKKTGSWNKSLGNLRLWDQSQSILTNSDKLWKQNNYSPIIFNNRDRDHHMPPMTRGQNTKYHDWELDHAITQNPTQLWKQSNFVQTKTKL